MIACFKKEIQEPTILKSYVPGTVPPEYTSFSDEFHANIKRETENDS